MCVCVFMNISQADLASREGAGDPQQVQSLEGHQNEADVGSQVLGTFWVHEMVGGVAAYVLFIAHSGCQVYSAKRPYKHGTDTVLTQAHTRKTRQFYWHKILFLSHITFLSYRAIFKWTNRPDLSYDSQVGMNLREHVTKITHMQTKRKVSGSQAWCHTPIKVLGWSDITWTLMYSSKGL